MPKNYPDLVAVSYTHLDVYKRQAFMQGDALVGIQGARFGIKMAWG